MYDHPGMRAGRCIGYARCMRLVWSPWLSLGMSTELMFRGTLLISCTRGIQSSSPRRGAKICDHWAVLKDISRVSSQCSVGFNALIMHFLRKDLSRNITYKIA
jgi:hypothetical protein